MYEPLEGKTLVDLETMLAETRSKVAGLKMDSWLGRGCEAYYRIELEEATQRVKLLSDAIQLVRNKPNSFKEFQSV